MLMGDAASSEDMLRDTAVCLLDALCLEATLMTRASFPLYSPRDWALWDLSETQPRTLVSEKPCLCPTPSVAVPAAG